MIRVRLEDRVGRHGFAHDPTQRVVFECQHAVVFIVLGQFHTVERGEDLGRRLAGAVESSLCGFAGQGGAIEHVLELQQGRLVVLSHGLLLRQTVAPRVGGTAEILVIGPQAQRSMAPNDLKQLLLHEHHIWRNGPFKQRQQLVPLVSDLRRCRCQPGSRNDRPLLFKTNKRQRVGEAAVAPADGVILRSGCHAIGLNLLEQISVLVIDGIRDFGNGFELRRTIFGTPMSGFWVNGTAHVAWFVFPRAASDIRCPEY